MAEEIREPCCDPWASAHQGGTDNEGWSKLISYTPDEEPSIGLELPPVRHCPWCGASKGMPPEEKRQRDIVWCYITLMCRLGDSKRFLARDLREGLAEELLKDD